MDANQFDELVARLAEGPSRRDALKGVLGGALASVGIGAAASDDAEGKGKGKGKARKSNNRGKGRKNNGRGGAQGQGDVSGDKKKNKSNKKKCKGDKKRCGSKKKCFDLQSSEQHCGVCGNACDIDETCEAGVCTPIS